MGGDDEKLLTSWRAHC